MKIDYKAFIAPKEEFKSQLSEEMLSEAADSLPNPAEETSVESDILDVFGMDSSGSATPTSVDPFSLTTGGSNLPPDMGIDPVTGKPTKTADIFPAPSIDEITSRAGFAMDMKTLDRIENTYNAALINYSADRVAIYNEIKSGALSPSEQNYKEQLLGIVDEAIAKIKENILLMPAKREELKQLYNDEAQDLKSIALSQYQQTDASIAKVFGDTDTKTKSDIVQNYFTKADRNKDGYIGEPDKGLRYGEHKDPKVGWIIWDPQTNVIIKTFNEKTGAPLGTKYSYDPANQWIVSNGYGVEMSNNKVGSEDLTFGITDKNQISQIENTFDAKIDIPIPEYITVIRDKETDSPKVIYDDDSGENRLSPLEFYKADNGRIMQKEPEDAEDCIQVWIASVEILSEENDIGLYDHVVKFLTADLEVAAELRYVDGSNYGVSFNGDHRDSVVEIDATGMDSTVQHGVRESVMNEYLMETTGAKTMDELIYGGAETSAEKARAGTAFSETMGHFTGAKRNGLKSADAENTTGIMVKGISGIVKGDDNANNFVAFKEVSEIPFDGSEANPLFANIFEGGEAQFNAAVANGKGDFIASHVTLAYKNNKTGNGTTQVIANNVLGGTTEVGDADTDYSDNEKRSPKLYINVTGAKKTLIDNPSDSIVGIPDKDPFSGEGDDYFNTNGEGQYSISAKPSEASSDSAAYDPDADSNNNAASDDFTISKQIDDFEAALMKLPLADENMIDEATIIEKLGGDYYNSILSSQDTFMADVEGMFGSISDDASQIDLSDDGPTDYNVK